MRFDHLVVVMMENHSFVSAGATEPMGYYPPDVLPFAYSLAQLHARQPLVLLRPGPTYPNRRFMLAGTAWGGTETSPSTLLDPPPPHGTIFDRMSEHHVTWCDCFTDLPMTVLIPSILLEHLDHYQGIAKFFHECQAGTLPEVSFVDPGVGVLSSIATALHGLPGVVKETLSLLGVNVDDLAQGETEEDPQDM